MKKWIQSSTKEPHVSACSFDFDLGDQYDSEWLEDQILDIFSMFDLEAYTVDFRSVEYPGNKMYSQAGVEFIWKGDDYNAKGIENTIAKLIDDEGGNFFGIDFYSLED